MRQQLNRTKHNRSFQALYITLGLLITILLLWRLEATAHTSNLTEPVQPVPWTSLIDQNGSTFSPDSYRDRTLLINFIYTHCPGPCSVVTNKLVSVQLSLPEKLRRRVHFISITLDPQRDTPSVLKAYAHKLGADLASWSFVTGPPHLIQAFTERFGRNLLPSKAKLEGHALTAWLVTQSGKVVQTYVGRGINAKRLQRDLTAADRVFSTP